MALLEVSDVHTYYGNIHALKGVSFTVDRGEIVALIGANGAGKTTTLKTISGLLHPRQGRIALEGRDITTMPAHSIVRQGVALVPEGRRVFGTLSVEENLELGAFTRTDRQGISRSLEYVYTLFPRLKERRAQLAGTLSGGEQQMLAIGRALMAQPRILLLDEPSMGLAPVLVDTIFDIIEQLHREGTTILLVEQNALKALSIADRGYVLQTGQMVLADTAQNLLRNEHVRRAYLGVA